MTRCRQCSSLIDESSRFCSSCGAATTASTPSIGRISTGFGPEAGGGFDPGTTIGGRFRIIGLLGRGGMGEVYRADDLKLDQAVALKFLPPAAAKDPVTLAAFHSEVRLARQISHPNLCRVYDIGEVDGRHFLSMEFVDGEDLASLLRRIGRLPGDKALQTARELCAGLAAVHDKGILHRDLKPANVMIDGDGHVRVTDFGLAGMVGKFTEAEAFAGTPAYMSPEQLSGTGITRQSDIYSLGLVLYELFTGKRAFDADSMIELIRRQQEEEPARPSTLVPDIDRGVERVILRCLDKNPERRPPSALTVSAALPGGDPLAEALAAGHTPSPEMVAAAGASEGIRPRLAWTLLAAFAAGMILTALLGEGSQTFRQVKLDKSPPVLEDRARTILEQAGLTAPPVHRAFGFYENGDYLQQILKTDKSPDRWKRLQTTPPSGFCFWYRQSPRPMVPVATYRKGRVDPSDPPLLRPGMASMSLSPDGRLIDMQIVPARYDSAAPGAVVDAGWLFQASGLESARFTPARPTWSPPVYCDTLMAWTGSYPGALHIPVTVEAGFFHGRPVYWSAYPPWSEKSATPASGGGLSKTLATVLSMFFIAVLLGGGLFMAIRNQRLEKAHTAGARKVGIAMILITLLSWLFAADHPGDAVAEFSTFFQTLREALLQGWIVWTLYMALEPYVRRVWPQTMITWTRFLSGRLRDPLVGRDILIGAVSGVGFEAISLLNRRIQGMLAGTPARPEMITEDSLLGFGKLAGVVLNSVAGMLVLPILILALIVLMQAILRGKRPALAIGAAWVLAVALQLGNGYDPSQLISQILFFTVSFVVVLRFGFFALMFGAYVATLFGAFPMTTDLNTWYASNTILGGVLIAAVVLYGFVTSVAGRPLFGSGPSAR